MTIKKKTIAFVVVEARLIVRILIYSIINRIINNSSNNVRTLIVTLQVLRIPCHLNTIFTLLWQPIAIVSKTYIMLGKSLKRIRDFQFIRTEQRPLLNIIQMLNHDVQLIRID